VSKVTDDGVTKHVELLEEVRRTPDIALVDACLNGDESAFDELVRRYKDRVYNVVYRFLGNHEDSLEVALEVFVRAYRSLDSFRGHAQVYTWLYSIAANTCRNRLRDRGRKGRDKGISFEALMESAPAVAQEATATHVTPSHLAEKRELNEGLKGCLEDLPDTYRLVFVLRTFDSLSYGDIAASVECPEGTVKSRLNQARKLLRECLGRRGLL
jgi:RNA polymerase sigma-70 factor (ECF subfamily)